MISGRNLSCILTEADQVFRIGADTVSLVAMPLFHIGGTGWALCGMSRGGHSVILRDIDPAEVLRLIEEHRITETFVVPAVLMFLLATPELATTDVSSLRTVFYGASPISEDVLVRSMSALGCDFAQVYGLTETDRRHHLAHARRPRPGRPARRLLRSAGRPFDHVELRIVDADTGRGPSGGAVGEVWTRSDQNMLGYWNKADETASVLSDDGWFRTGDAGWIDAGGLPVPPRPDQGHDRVRRREHLPGRGGERAPGPPGGGRRRRHRRARRQMGRDGQGHRGQGRRAHPTTTRHWPRTSSPPPATAWPTTSARPRSTSSTSCPATPRARCSSASSAALLGRPGAQHPLSAAATPAQNRPGRGRPRRSTPADSATRSSLPASSIDLVLVVRSGAGVVGWPMASSRGTSSSTRIRVRRSRRSSSSTISVARSSWSTRRSTSTTRSRTPR